MTGIPEKPPPVQRLIARPLFLTLRTTEPEGAGNIVRLEALRPAEAGTPARSVTLRARPAERLTLAQTRIAGETNQQLDSAPDLDQALEELLQYSEGAEAWIVPAGEAARRAFHRAGALAGFAGGFGFEILGADELGAVVHPTIVRRSTADLAAHYGLGPSDASGKMDLDPAFLQELWSRLEADLLSLPLPLLSEMNWLLAKSRHPLQGILKRAETRAVEANFSQTLATGKLSLAGQFKDFTPIIQALGSKGETSESAEALEAPPPPPKPVTDEQIEAVLGEKGNLAQAFELYEHRPEQIALARKVAQALSEGRHLIAEAGTGVGKSLAYLSAAVLFAQKNQRPVIVSTHTKNLQSQLFHHDLPLLKKALGKELNAALLKGRSNYLCARKFMYTLQESAHELDESERAALLPVMTWATQTQDGDVAELAAFSPEQQPELWDRLHTVGEDCLKRQCPFYHRCFVYKARGLARSADLVVTNHSVVFADLNQESGSLPDYEEIVFDEAHTLEDVATEHLACEITPRRAYRMLNRLFRAAPGSHAGRGLLPGLLFQLDQANSEIPVGQAGLVRDHALTAIQAVEPAGRGMEVFFEAAREWLRKPESQGEDTGPDPFHVPRERGRRESLPVRPGPAFRRNRDASAGREGPRRYGADRLQPEEHQALREAKETAVAGMGRLRQALEILEEDFKLLLKGSLPRSRELHKEISAQGIFLQELISDLEFVVRADEPNYVYWMEGFGRNGVRVVAAPLDLSALLHDQLYDRKRSVILTSATLSAREPVPPRSEASQSESDAGPNQGRKSFEFLKQRLGLARCAPGRLEELMEGSPFDYRKQCRLWVPIFLPEPDGAGARAFNQALSELIAPLALASRGRAMVLYTSYAALNAGAAALRRTLAPEGIEVLAQGEDGSREALLDKLKRGDRTVLLGTSSFWEGVDVRGAALSLLIIAKLPFAVFTDPLVQGRCELLEAQGKDPFLHYSVPHAILRLRQGFGRLIRSQTDRGVVILADKRVLTKRYGASFLRALPAAAETAHDPLALSEEVRAFLAEA